jgi:hypothetical protein
MSIEKHPPRSFKLRRSGMFDSSDLHAAPTELNVFGDGITIDMALLTELG